MRSLILIVLTLILAAFGVAVYTYTTSAPLDIARLKQRKHYCETLRKEIEDIKKLKITNSIAEAIRDCQKDGAWPEENE